jgi:hypothetical protein
MVDDDELDEGHVCPTCGTDLEERGPVPWYFRAMIVVTVLYLGYRTYQGVDWLIHHA